MRVVNILCTDSRHPVNSWLEVWCQKVRGRAVASILRDVSELKGGDFLFLVSCHQVVTAAERAKYDYTLVLHASDLPAGRGMSPHIWQILEGKSEITLTMLNAEDLLDSGDIWRQQKIKFDGTELFDEINEKVFRAEIDLMDWAIDNVESERPTKQQGNSSFYRRRTPEDGRVSADSTIAEIFNLLRVSDPDRYPAFFDRLGCRYDIRIVKRR